MRAQTRHVADGGDLGIIRGLLAFQNFAGGHYEQLLKVESN